MTTTLFKELTAPATATIMLDGPDVLPQLCSVAGRQSARAGKNAYDMLAKVREGTAMEIQESLGSLGLPSIKSRRLDQPAGRCLAFAAAALADSSRGNVRRTGSERIVAAMDLLDNQLCAGW